MIEAAWRIAIVCLTDTGNGIPKVIAREEVFRPKVLLNDVGCESTMRQIGGLVAAAYVVQERAGYENESFCCSERAVRT